MNNEFITILTRADLQAGYKVVQTAHALADFAVQHRDEFLNWQRGSNYLCCLEATEYKIQKILYKLDDLGLKYTIFREPDIENQMTAVAVEAISRTEHRKLFKNLKLTLSS